MPANRSVRHKRMFSSFSTRKWQPYDCVNSNSSDGVVEKSSAALAIGMKSVVLLHSRQKLRLVFARFRMTLMCSISSTTSLCCDPSICFADDIGYPPKRFRDKIKIVHVDSFSSALMSVSLGF